MGRSFIQRSSPSTGMHTDSYSLYYFLSRLQEDLTTSFTKCEVARDRILKLKKDRDRLRDQVKEMEKEIEGLISRDMERERKEEEILRVKVS